MSLQDNKSHIYIFTLHLINGFIVCNYGIYYKSIIISDHEHLCEHYTAALTGTAADISLKTSQTKAVLNFIYRAVLTDSNSL